MPRTTYYLLIVFALNATANESIEICTKPNLKIKSNNVFNSKESGFFWLHRFANDIHIVTQKIAIKNALKAFNQCEESLDAYEMERYLRDLNYLRDASVEKKSDHYQIETWDNWTLQPNLSFGRNGNENEWSFGLSDDNIMGLGIGSSLKYQSNADRSGFEFSFNAPINLLRPIHTQVYFGKSDDGFSRGGAISSPFYSVSTLFAGELMIDQEKKQFILKENHINKAQDELETNFAQAWFGWSSEKVKNKEAIKRIKLGLTYQTFDFKNINSVNYFEDRKSLYPWWEIEYYRDQFTKMRNIDSINKNEDINLGHRLILRLGYDLENNDSDAMALILMGYFRHAFKSSRNWLFRFLVKGNARQLKKNHIAYLTNALAESFYTFHPYFTFYNHLSLVNSRYQFKDQPVTLGGDNGLSAYPVQYAHGDSYYLFRSELRWNPNISLIQLIDLSAALFLGSGKIISPSENMTPAMHTIGFGIRLHSARSSHQNAIFIDFARPISKDKKLNGWDWQVKGKTQF